MRVRALIAAITFLPLAVWAEHAPSDISAPEVVIDPGGVGPESLKAIYGAVNAITRLAEDQDLDEISRLRRRAHEATVSALQTQGYYDPVVTLEVGEDFEGETWDILIEPGERTRVKRVNIDFTGQITDPQFTVRVEGIRKNWTLNEGDLFLNHDWSNAKADLLQSVKSKDFYYARYTHTKATVVADLNTADLDLAVRSGPRVQMGDLHTAGLKRVPEKLVRRYVKYEPGDSYDQEKLDEWQQALQSTTFFRGAFVTLEDTSTERSNEDGEVVLPVLVRVTEAPARRFTGSLGVDSDHGPRLEAFYRQNIVFGQPVWTETGLGVDKNRQRFFSDVHFPPTYKGFKNSVGVLYEHEDIEGLKQTRAAAGIKSQYEFNTNTRADYETTWSLMGVWDESRVSGEPKAQRGTSLEATWQVLRRNVDDKYDPREGNLFDVDVGVNYPLGGGKKTLYRTGMRAQQWIPIGKNDVFMLRGEVGKVWPSTDRIPMGFGYRTGGARSVRGYKYYSLGRERGSATVGAPVMAVLSAEYQYFFNPTYGMSVFVDVGDAGESFKDLSPHWGYGVGAAVRTPAGPFYVDVAYGQKTRDVRLHFSLGIAF
ncbi:autotransporter assembly complex family protein [uncultured Paenalcaligenes sp.]|uniref:autotransporter assembly complex protein TamA n=1 Tax=uncultured Paenalcaligenes sp. TaxID=1588925 RepID=UPI00261CAB14|nr:BamA/TamA family outer membrane protein [uncultured Paenalcaligenes sp.]